MHIRKDDHVIMLIGKDKGKTGKILRVLPTETKVIIEGLNLIKKHRRPKKQGQKGETISMPRSIDVSNVMLICRHCGKASRMGARREDKKIIRICKKCGGEN